MIRFRARKTFRLWPLYWTFTQNGFSSWGIRVWRFSYNVTRRTWSLDTPGPGGLYGGKRRRSR